MAMTSTTTQMTEKSVYLQEVLKADATTVANRDINPEIVRKRRKKVIKPHWKEIKNYRKLNADIVKKKDTSSKTVLN